MYGAKEIPSIGRLEFTWVNMPLPPVLVPSSRPDGVKNGDTEMGNAHADGDEQGDLGGQQGLREVDYDVAEDDDRWMVS